MNIDLLHGAALTAIRMFGAYRTALTEAAGEPEVLTEKLVALSNAMAAVQSALDAPAPRE